MIKFKNVNKWFKELHVLSDINLEVKKGEVVVVCGPSGSGKSTLIRTVNQLEQIQSGEIWVDGVDVASPATDLNKIRAEVGFVFQHFNLYPHLSVLENIVLSPKKKRCNSWSAWAWRTKKTPCQASFPAASSSAWPSPAAWPWSRK